MALKGLGPVDLYENQLTDVSGLEAFTSEFGQGIVRGFLNVGEGIVGTAEFLIPGEQESLLGAKERIAETAEEFEAEYGGISGKAGRILGEALPYMGAALAGGYAAGGAAALAGATAKGVSVAAGFGAASVAFSVEGQNAYDEAIRTGASEKEAIAERLIIGSINAAIEAAQITRLMKFHKTGSLSLKSFIRNVRNRAWDAVKGDAKQFTGLVLRTALEEGLEEAAQEGVSISVPGFLRGEMPRDEEGNIDWGQVVDRVGSAAIGGAFAGAVLGGAGAMIGAAPEIGRPSDTEIDSVIEKVNALDIDPKEKELWISRLEEQRVEEREVEVGEEVPEVKEAESEILDTPALHREWDETLISSVKTMDTSLRETHKEQIKKLTGDRIQAAGAVMADPSINPMIRWKQARKFMSGELGLRFEPLKADENQINYFYQRVMISDLQDFEKFSAMSGLDSLFGLYKDSKGRAKLPEPKQIENLEKVWGTEFSQALNSLRGYKLSRVDKLLETLNFPRAVLASFDFSAAGRQGLMLLPMAPKQWIKSVGQGYRAWASPQYAKHIELQIKTDPVYGLYKKAGGEFTEVGDMVRGEEVFMSRLAKKIPGITASERAYTTTLNSLRFYTFKKYAQKWEGAGKLDTDYRLLSDFIRHTTGRGDLKGLKKYQPFLNAAFFAPRLTMGRIQALTDVFKGVGADIKARRFNPVRKIIAADLVGFFGAGAGILWLLSMMKGVDVEKDPRSSDFGKVRFGKTRLDFWGGYSQMARLVARMATGEITSTVTKDVSEAQRGQILWRFLQSKMSPAAGISVDLVRGETFLGEPLELTGEIVASQAFQRFVPLFFQDVADALHYQGLTTAGIVAPLAVHGIGAMTYTPSPSSEVHRMKDVHAMEVFGREWDTLSPEGQKLLREARPGIVLAEKKARMSRKNFGRIAESLREQRGITNKLLKGLPKPIKKELKDLDVYLPGLSRRVAGDWYLNDKRYKQYQNILKESMSVYFRKLISLPMWKGLDSAMKASLVEELFKDIKKEAIEELTKDATINDFVRR